MKQVEHGGQRRTGGGALFLPNCIRFVRKRHWPSRLWNDLLIPRRDISICRDAVDTFSRQTRRCSINPGAEALWERIKITESEAENQSNDCSKHHWYLTNEGLSGNGDAGTHRDRFHEVDFEIYRLFCSNDGKLDQRKGEWVKGGLSAGPCMGPNYGGFALSLVLKRRL